MSNKAEHKLFNRNFSAACTANFLYFFGFYSLLPIMALYLIETFQAKEVSTGIILACYTIAALLFRPFGGYLVDKFDRKKMYIISLALFVLCFLAYPLAGSLAIFIIIRILHGFSFGSLTVSANTLIIDISPSEKRGEALGIFGIANTTAMAVGPMVAVQLHKNFGYNTVFYAALTVGIIAFIIGSTIKSQKISENNHEAISLDRFILFKGLPAGTSLLLLGIPYGMLTTYIAIYSLELGFGSDTGWFYSLLALGIILSRIFSGKQTDKGKLTQVISLGAAICALSLILLTLSKQEVGINNTLAKLMFNGAALVAGLGYGSVFPAMNTLFVNLAAHNRRGTASSTYMTTWDIGVGLGLIFSSQIGKAFGYSIVFLIGSASALLSVIFFELYAKKHYLRNKLEL